MKYVLKTIIPDISTVSPTNKPILVGCIASGSSVNGAMNAMINLAKAANVSALGATDYTCIEFEILPYSTAGSISIYFVIQDFNQLKQVQANY